MLYREVQEDGSSRRLGRVFFWCGLGCVAGGGAVLRVNGSGWLWPGFLVFFGCFFLLLAAFLQWLDTSAVIEVRPTSLHLRTWEILPPLPPARIEAMRRVRHSDIKVYKPPGEWGRIGTPRLLPGTVRNERGEYQRVDLTYGIAGDHGVIVDFRDPLRRVYLRTRHPEALMQALDRGRAEAPAASEPDPAHRSLAQRPFSEKARIGVALAALWLGAPLLLLTIVIVMLRRGG